MNDQQINIAIAEALGIRIDRPATGWHDVGCVCQKCHPIPCYSRDLNAMHSAVMSIDFDQRARFRQELQWIVAPSTKPGKCCGIKLMNKDSYDAWFNATARQRAEAFLRTIGKWEETE